MELNWIEKTITALADVGIPAQRGYPSGIIPSLTSPMATVSIKKAEQDELTLSVSVYTPLSDGGTACEDLALTAAEALRALGAECELGACGFSGKGGLFSLPVLAKFTGELTTAEKIKLIPKVEIDDVVQTGLSDVTVAYTCSTVKVKDTTTSEIEMASADRRWHITIEDVVDARSAPIEAIEDGFAMVISRSEQEETYSGCCWEKQSTQTEGERIRRVRVAVTCNDPTIAAL